MSTLSLRLPKSLHSMARELAREEKISVNQLITLALGEKLAALKTEEFFSAKAKHSSRAKFERALAKVAKSGPAEHDCLPHSHRK